MEKKEPIPTALLSSADCGWCEQEGNGRQRDVEKEIQPADSSTIRSVQLAEYGDVLVPLAEQRKY